MKNVKPTKLQERAVEILKDAPSMAVGEAMRQAGYSERTSTHPKQNFIDLKGTQIALDKWREALRGSGLNENKLIEKYSEWLDAHKISTSLTEPDKIVPDYTTQLKAAEWLREDLGVKQDKATILQQMNVGEMILEFTDNESKTK
jgi:hypothetical protein